MLNTKYFKDLINFNKKCEVYFSKQEIKTYDIKFSFLPMDYVLIISEVTNHLKVKNWGFENMQKLVHLSNNEFNFVQIGTSNERLLDGISFDLRNKTNLRELLYLVKNAKFIVCTEGLLTHASSAFDIPCFTIFSGYHPIEISMYDNVIPITFQSTCCDFPCWNNICIYSNYPKCFLDLTPNYVLSIISKYF